MEKLRKVDSIGGEVGMDLLLPEDLVFDEILTRLPVKSLMRFKCVSKSWMTRISCVSFSDTHSRQQQRDDGLALVFYGNHSGKSGRLRVKLHSEQWSKETEVPSRYLYAENNFFAVAGSCNGLICLSTSDAPKKLFLWNPATRNLRQLPEAPQARDGFPAILGLGRDATSREFKVVVLEFSYNGNNNLSGDWPLVRSHIFAKSGTVWRGSNVPGIAGCINDGFAVAVDGALHWVLYRYQARRGVLSFDLSKEVLRVSEGPSDCAGFSLCKWGSSLAALTMCDLWTASSSGDGLRWTKILEFKLPVHAEHLSMVWREQFVVLRKRNYRKGWKLLLMDPENGSKRILKVSGATNIFPHFACNYIESVLSVF